MSRHCYVKLWIFKFSFFFPVVLDTFPAWLGKALASIKSINSQLKKIAHEEKETRLAALGDGRRKEESDDDDLEIGPRDCDIDKKIVFLKCGISFICLMNPSAVVQRIKAGSLDIENFCLGCHVEIHGSCLEHPIFIGGRLCYGGSCKVT